MSDKVEWVCPICGRKQPFLEAGARCTDHPDGVLLPPETFESFHDDRVLGRLVAGKYAVYDVLGMGGFGAVYKAVQEPVGRPVALKVVHPQHAEKPDLRARFFREAKLVARLKDSATVTLYDYGEEDDLGLFMVFELVEGVTLDQIMDHGPVDPIRVAHILLELLRALAEAHSMGVIHRDLKPANVMLLRDTAGNEAVRLLDFGIAKLVDHTAGEQRRTVETQEGLVMGTPRYISPEQARALGNVDLRSDLYSLGVMGYAMLAGDNPFRRPSVIETIMAHCNDTPPPLDPALGVPPAFEEAVLRAVEKVPEDRFSSAHEMAEAIQSAFDIIALPSSWGRLSSIVGSLPENPLPTRSASGTTPSAGRYTGRRSGHTAAFTGSLPLSGGVSKQRQAVWLVAALGMFGLGIGLGLWLFRERVGPVPVKVMPPETTHSSSTPPNLEVVSPEPSPRTTIVVEPMPAPEERVEPELKKPLRTPVIEPEPQRSKDRSETPPKLPPKDVESNTDRLQVPEF